MPPTPPHHRGKAGPGSSISALNIETSHSQQRHLRAEPILVGDYNILSLNVGARQTSPAGNRRKKHADDTEDAGERNAAQDISGPTGSSEAASSTTAQEHTPSPQFTANITVNIGVEALAKPRCLPALPRPLITFREEEVQLIGRSRSPRR